MAGYDTTPGSGAARAGDPAIPGQPADATPDRPLTDLLSDLTGQVSTLMRQEVALAKAEVRQEAKQAGQAGGALAGGGVAAFVALLLIAMAASWGLAELMPPGWAFLIVGVVFAIVAAVLLQSGRKRLQQVNPAPQQTVETLKEDAQWLKDHRQ